MVKRGHLSGPNPIRTGVLVRRGGSTEKRPCEDTARRQPAIYELRRDASEENDFANTLTSAFEPQELRK